MKHKLLFYIMISLLILSHLLIWFKIGTYDKANEELNDYILAQQEFTITVASFANTTTNALVHIIKEQQQLKVNCTETSKGEYISEGSSYYNITLDPSVDRNYEDEFGCLVYQLNITAEPYEELFELCDNEGNCWKNYHHEYIPTVCIEYANGTILDIPTHIYDFEWCEVYPNSEDCA